MAYWNLSFDGAAIFILLLVFIWYFNEKRIPIRSHRSFLMFMAATFAATGLEVLATQMAQNISEAGYDRFFAVLTLQTLAIHLVTISFAHYLLLLAHVNIHGNFVIRNFFRICTVFDIAVVALNFRLHWLFTFENGMYHSGVGEYFMYGIDGIMLVICVVTMICSKQNFKFLRLMPLAFTIVCSILACIAQVFYYIPLINFVLASICLTVYHYQQNTGTVTDVVTGQFNRRFLGEYIRNKFLEKREFGIIVVAMDDFKFVNKTYGVETGDHLLYQVGQFLERIKAAKTVFRFGSDQFCVVLDKNVDTIAELAGQILSRFRHPWYSEDQTAVMMSASICCMECPRDAQNYGDLIEVMDYSMSVAKNTRKGLITPANEIDLDKIKLDKAIEKAVKLAIDRDELLVYYQPIFSVTKGVYNSAEALVRLNDEKLGWISPEDFIPIAEKNGLIVEMGELILEKVCRFIRDFNLSETTVEYIEVNISPVQLLQHDFADRVKGILEKYNVKPNQINIEITETATLNSASMVSENINSLVNYGVTFSLDDYGSGNANIDYINHMPFKIIKIDKYIIWDSFKNSKAGITLEYTIGMLNALELYIVAEGVETEEMKQQLAEFGCHYMQGWLYSKAVPDVEFMKLLQAPS
ncbi:MAG: GGDEF and EAL domain-containing protein [Clostridium sp.]|nr:GGDEF and EAL domain-containing protein [Clostridium sp.]